MATSEELPPLNSALRDLSHRVSAPPPPRQSPQAPLVQRASAAPARPPPSASGKNPSPRPHDPPTPLYNVDPSLHCPYYDTRLWIMFGDPELYATAFPHSWEAEQFGTGKYDLSKFTPATQPPDYKPKHFPTYAQAAGSGRPPSCKRGKKSTTTEVAHPAVEPSKPATSLPLASRHFLAIKETPSPHPLAARITKTFPDIVATTLTESNCLLPKGLRVKVNDRGAVSLTGLTPSPPPDPTPPTSMPSPGASTSHIPRDLPPGYHSPWRQPLYSWQYTPSPLTSSPTTTTNYSPSSRHPSSTRKRSRSVRPGHLTRTELLQYPNKRLR